jgi:hypothetical protein
MPDYTLSNKGYRWAAVLLILTGLLLFISGCDIVYEERGIIPQPPADSAHSAQAQAPAPTISRSGVPTGGPSGPATYKGTAKITRTGTNCVINATGSLVINSDKTVRVELSGPMLNNYQTCSLESSKEGWIFKGSADSGTITFTSCNNSGEMQSEGSGNYSDQTAAISARCVENKSGDYLAIDANFTR